MPTDLRTVLSRAADGRVADLDVDLVIRAGRSRRVRVLATQAAAGLAALALLGTAGLTLLPGDQRAVTLGPAPAGLQVPELPSEELPPVALPSGPATDAAPDASSGQTGQDAIGSWESVPDAPLQPVEYASAIDLGDGTVLVVGGAAPGASAMTAYPQSARYDLAARAWTALSDVPIDLAPGGSQHLAAIPAGDGRALAWRMWAGGPDLFAAALFDAATGEWTATGEAPLSPRVEAGVAWVADQLVVWGGGGAADGAVWTPGSGWTPMAAAPFTPSGAAVLADLDGRLLAWAGEGGLYDPASDTWTRLADAPLSSGDHVTATVDDGGFLVSDGRRAARYDVAAGAWQALPAPPAGTHDVLADGGWLVAYTGSGAAVYDAETATWIGVEDPAIESPWLWEQVSVGDLTVRIADGGPPGEVMPLGGLVRAPGGDWQPLPDADTPTRRGRAVAVVGDTAVFVWGGASPTGDRTVEPPTNIERYHADGAVWRP